MKLWRGTALALIAVAVPACGDAAAQRAAMFAFEFVDTSLEPQRPDETARLTKLDTELSAMLARSGRYTPVNLGPVAAVAHTMNLRQCGGCDVSLAESTGAEVSVTGWVQKVSNLILNINLVVRQVPGGRVIRVGSVDIRGNTDERWSRGLIYLLRNRVLTEDAK